MGVRGEVRVRGGVRSGVRVGVRAEGEKWEVRAEWWG